MASVVCKEQDTKSQPPPGTCWRTIRYQEPSERPKSLRRLQCTGWPVVCTAKSTNDSELVRSIPPPFPSRQQTRWLPVADRWCSGQMEPTSSTDSAWPHTTKSGANYVFHCQGAIMPRDYSRARVAKQSALLAGVGKAPKNRSAVW